MGFLRETPIVRRSRRIYIATKGQHVVKDGGIHSGIDAATAWMRIAARRLAT